MWPLNHWTPFVVPLATPRASGGQPSSRAREPLTPAPATTLRCLVADFVDRKKAETPVIATRFAITAPFIAYLVVCRHSVLGGRSAGLAGNAAGKGDSASRYYVVMAAEGASGKGPPTVYGGVGMRLPPRRHPRACVGSIGSPCRQHTGAIT